VSVDPSDNVTSLVISPDGRLLVSTGHGNSNSIRLWRLPDGKALCSLEGHTGWIRALAMTPDSRTLISASEDGTVRLWGS